MGYHSVLVWELHKLELENSACADKKTSVLTQSTLIIFMLSSVPEVTSGAYHLLFSNLVQP